MIQGDEWETQENKTVLVADLLAEDFGWEDDHILLV